MGVLLLSLNSARSSVGRTPMGTVAVTDKDINKVLPVSLKYSILYSW